MPFLAQKATATCSPSCERQLPTHPHDKPPLSLNAHLHPHPSAAQSHDGAMRLLRRLRNSTSSHLHIIARRVHLLELVEAQISTRDHSRPQSSDNFHPIYIISICTVYIQRSTTQLLPRPQTRACPNKRFTQSYTRPPTSRIIKSAHFPPIK